MRDGIRTDWQDLSNCERRQKWCSKVQRTKWLGSKCRRAHKKAEKCLNPAVETGNLQISQAALQSMKLCMQTDLNAEKWKRKRKKILKLYNYRIFDNWFDSPQSYLWNLNWSAWKFVENVASHESNQPRRKANVCWKVSQFHLVAVQTAKKKLFRLW